MLSHRVHITPRGRRNARHALQQVERHPFARQDRAAGAGHHRDDVALIHPVAVRHERLKLNGRIKGRKDPCRDLEASDDTRRLDEKIAGVGGVGRDGIQGGNVAITQVFGQGG